MKTRCYAVALSALLPAASLAHAQDSNEAVVIPAAAPIAQVAEDGTVQPITKLQSAATAQTSPEAEIPPPTVVDEVLAEEATPIAEAPAPAKVTNTLEEGYKGIVRVEVASQRPDYGTPWQPGRHQSGTGTGFMVGKGLFMTNAHVVADGERIYVSQYADSRKIRARVKHVAHDADLALIEVEDASAFENIPCLEFSDEVPALEDEVRAVGYPIGGSRLSVTRGIVSRIEMNQYSHPRNSAHLAVQIDAAINPGNSGGPVLKGDKVVGVAFQGLTEANSTGYMIPIPVIQRFLKDIEDGKYDGYINLGVQFFPIQNPAMRQHFGLRDDGRGALVGEVIIGGGCDGVLKNGDIVLAVDGHPVDNSGMIELEGLRVQLVELAERSFMGDKVVFTILRDAKVEKLEATLKPQPDGNIMGMSFDTLPRYVVYGGLVFQPLNLNVINSAKLNINDIYYDLDQFIRCGACTEKDDIVVITKSMPDEVNSRLPDLGSRIVTKVNGEPLRGLSHLYEMLYPESEEGQPDYITIEVEGTERPLVFSRAAMKDANARIGKSYGISAPARLNDQVQ